MGRMKTDVRRILDALGRNAVSTALQVTVKSMSRAAIDDKCPASWFVVLRAMAAKAGIDCPECLFSFKEVPAEFAAHDAGAVE